MATTTLTEMVTKTISGTAGTASSSSRAAPQGGVLDGGNPAKFDAKNPIALFIIQVRTLMSLTAILDVTDFA
jgi:hypothetical protein